MICQRFPSKVWQSMRKGLTMIIASSNTIEGKKIETLGMVQGSYVFSRHAAHDLAAGVKNFAGCENKLLTKVSTEARIEACNRMAERAKDLNADAVCAVRYAGSSYGEGIVEVACYGTAVKFV